MRPILGHAGWASAEAIHISLLSILAICAQKNLAKTEVSGL
jgi:hypothetical protein